MSSEGKCGATTLPAPLSLSHPFSPSIVPILRQAGARIAALESESAELRSALKKAKTDAKVDKRSLKKEAEERMERLAAEARDSEQQMVRTRTPEEGSNWPCFGAAAFLEDACFESGRLSSRLPVCLPLPLRWLRWSLRCRRCWRRRKQSMRSFETRTRTSKQHC